MRRPILLAALALAAAAPLAAQREQPPAPGTPKPIAIPKSRDFTLPNGLRVSLVPFGTVPKAAIRLQLRVGGANEPIGKAGLLQMAGLWLPEGTASRTGAQLAETFAGMGGSLGVSTGGDESSVGTEVLGDVAPEAIALLGEVVRTPRFDAADFQRVRTNALRNVAIARSRAQTTAQEQFAKAIYGDHPFAQVVPSEAFLQSVTPDEVAAFWRANTGAQRARLYVVGVFDPAKVEAAIRAAFGPWAKGPAPALNPATPKRGRTLDLIDRPKAVQSTILVGLPVADPSSPDYTALEVTDYLLGGAFGSRITSNIREQKGYTYSPFSTLDDRYRSAVWYEAADVTASATGASLTEIFAEIAKLRQEAPTASELNGIKQNMIGIFTLQNSSRGGIIGQLAYADLHGLGAAYAAGYAKRVLAVTPEQVRATATKYLDPAQMKIVVVGDEATVREQVAPFRGVTP